MYYAFPGWQGKAGRHDNSEHTSTGGCSAWRTKTGLFSSVTANATSRPSTNKWPLTSGTDRKKSAKQQYQLHIPCIAGSGYAITFDRKKALCLSAPRVNSSTKNKTTWRRGAHQNLIWAAKKAADKHQWDIHNAQGKRCSARMAMRNESKIHTQQACWVASNKYAWRRRHSIQLNIAEARAQPACWWLLEWLSSKIF